MNAIWDDATAHAIGATWLLDAIAPAGSFGRRARARERPFLAGDEVAARAAIARVCEIAEVASDASLGALREAIARAPDLGAIFVRAAGGAILDDVDLFEVGRLVDALADVRARARDVVPDTQTFEADAIAAAREALEPGRTHGRGFYLADAFDATLAVARGDAARAQAAYDLERSRSAEKVAAYAGIERVRDGEFLLMRDAIAGPLPPEIRVVRETPTYLLCEIALDERALAALGARDAAGDRVATAEEAVRARLSRVVARAGEDFERACDALGDLDALVARARFAKRYACAAPTFANDGYALVDARYEPLRETLAAHGRAYVPVSLELDGLGVVTGPNMGGKTAALRTLGFVAACAALGVPVPATSARVVLVDEIVWLGIGAAANDDDGLLSSFGSEVVGLRTFLARDARRALVLVDEFARTTSPREGRALLVALLERLRERGAIGLAATHLADIAASARVAHYAVGGSRAAATGDASANGDDDERADEVAPLELEAALARLARATDYRLARVDESAVPVADALALARALGLDARFVARARAALADARGPQP